MKNLQYDTFGIKSVPSKKGIMKKDFVTKRTESHDPHFQQLIMLLDNELWNEMMEDQSTYDQYNKVPDINTVVLVYHEDLPIACGCFKNYNSNTVEIKRMFTRPAYRGKGVAALLLAELEKWAIELHFEFAILETGKKLFSARKLYENAGYHVTENYDQYIGMEESVCMRKKLQDIIPASEFLNNKNIEYFQFEEDFVENKIRCIPMIVRFKMDKVGIKLKLAEWAKFSVEERLSLATLPVNNNNELSNYHQFLAELILVYAGTKPTIIEVDTHPIWSDKNKIPDAFLEKATSLGFTITVDQWSALSELQRFALMKLCRPGHENRNFPIALKEFRLV